MIARILSVGRIGRLIALAILISLTWLATTQIPNLKIDRSDDKLISADDPGWPALLDMQAHFGEEQTVLIYVRDPELWQREKLLKLQQFSFDLEDLPEIASVSSLFNSTNIRDKGDYVEAGPLMDLVPRSDDGIARIFDDAMYSPLMRRNVISEDGLATVLSLSYVDDPDNPDHAIEIYRLLEEQIETIRADFASVFQVGTPRLNHEIDVGLFRDLKLLIPCALGILLLTITFFLRSIRPLPIPLNYVVNHPRLDIWLHGLVRHSDYAANGNGAGAGDCDWLDRRRASDFGLHDKPTGS